MWTDLYFGYAFVANHALVLWRAFRPGSIRRIWHILMTVTLAVSGGCASTITYGEVRRARAVSRDAGGLGARFGPDVALVESAPAGAAWRWGGGMTALRQALSSLR